MCIGATWEMNSLSAHRFPSSPLCSSSSSFGQRVPTDGLGQAINCNQIAGRDSLHHENTTKHNPEYTYWWYTWLMFQ